MKSPNCNLVEIAVFNNSVEATLTQGILKDQGIESWLRDEAMVNIAWHLTVALGYIKLSVMAEDVELAKTILDEYQASSNEKTSEDQDLKDEEEALSELSSTDKILRSAFRSAVVGLIILPVQLYSLWLLLTLFWKGLPRTPRQYLTFLSTLGLDLAVLIVIASVI